MLKIPQSSVPQVAAKPGRWSRKQGIALGFCWLVTSSLVMAEPPKLDLTQALGSRANPVRACQPIGQREYLLRLKCADGLRPEFSRAGSVGTGPYGNIVDLYELRCGSESSAVHIDMYHCPYREKEPLPGFSIFSELPGKLAKGCPPTLDGVSDPGFVFQGQELRFPVEPPSGTYSGPADAPGTLVPFQVVVTQSGAIDESTLRLMTWTGQKLLEQVPPADPVIRSRALEQIRALKFQPARHSENCPVRQQVRLVVRVAP